ncbi:hypothetical protein F5Y15DRAFT_305287 [Xylariaceae sp. FL0016]|nr:hypothetical protein F5Y15DRAFT_305287 [Xylariaceae sp. FL0016]
MSRPRAPRPMAIASILFRSLGMIVSVILLSNLVYESVHWADEGKTYWLSMLTAIAAIIIDGSEVTGLLDTTRTIPRTAPGCLICSDVIVICLAGPSIALVFFSDYSRSGGYIPEVPWPWANADFLTIILTAALCGCRLLLLAWTFVDTRYSTRAARRQRDQRYHRDWPHEAPYVQEVN